MKIGFISAAFILLAVIPVWLLVILPRFPRIPSNFSYKADIVSLDNFYDEEKKTHVGAQISKTQFYYETVSKQNGILIIRNVFDVHKMTGERIFSVERLYGIDPMTGRHVKGFGDHDREGVLFAPAHLKKEDYGYWHVNYDEPAHLKFQAEENIQGLTVYRYETNYHADQTKNLGFLPGVPEKRGVNLDINLQTWIEPVSGHLVKYEDKTIAYYYDSHTRERLHPWNKFNNRYSMTSIMEQVASAKKEKQRIIFYEQILPGLLAGGALLFFVFPNFLKKE